MGHNDVPIIEVGRGVAIEEDSFKGGAEAARTALSSIKTLSVSAVLIFASARYDLGQVLSGVRSVTGEVPIFGATTAGEICDGSYEKSVVVVMLASPHLKVDVGVGREVSTDWRQAVEDAVQSPSILPYFSPQDNSIWNEMMHAGESAFAIIFAPGNTRHSDSRGYEIAEELRKLSGRRLPMFGGCAADDWIMEENYVLSGIHALKDSLIIAVFRTSLKFGIGMAHGFHPASTRVTVTGVGEHELLEMNGRPADEVYAEMVGATVECLQGKHLTLSTGKPLGIWDAYGQHTINVATYFTDRRGVRLAQPVLAGTSLTLMEPSREGMLGAGREALLRAMLRSNINDAAAVISCSCALRSRILGEDTPEEIERMKELLPNVPIVGFYSFGEFGMTIDGVNRHNNEVTVVLLLGREQTYSAHVAAENELLRIQLESSLAEISRTEEALRRTNDELESRVGQRTAALAKTNANLFIEIRDRKRAEEALHQAKEDLETKVLERTADLQRAYEQLQVELTERKRAEEALRASEEKFKGISNSVQDAIVVVNDRGEISFWNPAAERIFGYADSEVIGKNVHELLAPQEFADAYYSGVSRFAENGEGAAVNRTVSLTAVRRNGEKFPIELSLSSFRRDNCWHAVGTARDITERKKVEEALRESEEQYREIVEMSDDIAYRTDARGMFKFVNRVVRKITGYLEAELIGLHYTDLIPLEYREASEKFYGRQFVKKIPTTYYELPIRTKAGEMLWVGQNVQLLTKNEEVIGFQAIVRDITRSKMAEKALEASEQRYRCLFEDAPLMYVITRNVDGAPFVTDCNERFLSSLGYLREEVQGKPLADFYSPESRTIMLESGFARALSGEFLIGERQLLARDGRLIPTLVYTTTEHDPAGNVIGTRGMFVDISDRKQAEEALRRSERLYRSVIENVEDVFYRSDAEGRFLMVSPSGATLFGYGSVAEMIGLPLESFWINQDERRRLFEIVREQAKVTDFEGLLRKKDGSTFVASISAHFYRDEDGAVLGTEGIIRDISERRRIEAQLMRSQKMEALGTLAGGVAHEINNLLQIVLGHADMLLRRGGLDEKIGKSLKAIQRASRNGSDLVNRILTFSRKAEPKMRPLDLSHEVIRIEDMLRRTIPRMISLEMALQDELLTINADPSQIEQVLVNLTLNARDAMPEGGRIVFETNNVTIREEYCRTHPEIKPGKYVLLAVSDTGQGMSAGVSDHIFEPFFTTKQAGHGSGLGLSIVFGIVKNHGGHISCYSEAGIGTTFKILFPAAADSVQSDPATTLEMPAGGTETLLLVDDEDDVRTLGAEMLEMAGYTVLTAANGREALEVYRNEMESISLVILDLVMPEMSGRQCLEQLLKTNPNARVLVASGYAANGPAKEARQSGATGFVNKPFDLAEFLLAIRKCLNH